MSNSIIANIIKDRENEIYHSSNKINEIHCKKLDAYIKSYKKIGMGGQGFVLDWFDTLVIKIVPWRKEYKKKYSQKKVIKRVQELIINNKDQKSKLFIPIVPKIIFCSDHYIFLMEKIKKKYGELLSENYLNGDKYNTTKFAKSIILQQLTALNFYYQKGYMHGDTHLFNKMFYKIPKKYKQNFKVKYNINELNYEIEYNDYIFMFIDFDSIRKINEKDKLFIKAKGNYNIMHELLNIFKIFKLENINEYFITVLEHSSIYYKHEKYLRYKPKKYNQFYNDLYKKDLKFKEYIDNFNYNKLENNISKQHNNNIFFKVPNKLGEFIHNIYLNNFNIIETKDIKKIIKFIYEMKI